MVIQKRREDDNRMNQMQMDEDQQRNHNMDSQN